MTVKVKGMAQDKVDASAVAIQAGDLLVISPTNGNAVSTRSNQVDSDSQLTVKGTALESLTDGSGLLWVLVDPR